MGEEKGFIGRVLLVAVPVMTALVLLFAGCGGGGGGSSSPPAASNVAIVKLSVQGGTTTVAGVDVTVDLPPGVTVATDQVSGQVVATSLFASGGGSSSTVLGRYIPATATTPAKVHIGVINSVGFPAGEFATMKCDIAPGTSPQAAGFTVETGASVIDTVGGPLPGASVVLSVTL